MNTKIDISKNMATQNSNFPILAVSNRHLAAHPFLDQIERVCQAHPAALILREKDLPAEDYKPLPQGFCPSANNTMFPASCIHSGRMRLPLDVPASTCRCRCFAALQVPMEPPWKNWQVFPSSAPPSTPWTKRWKPKGSAQRTLPPGTFM